MANKKTLTDAVAQATGKTKKDSKVIVETVMGIIVDTLASGDEVKLVNFGKFSTRQRAERKGINPQTKEPMIIKAATVVKFKAGKGLAETVNA
jgi:DNA-binding protein HU-beta